MKSHEINKETIFNMTEDLLSMAKEMTWNKLSNQCYYILSEENFSDNGEDGSNRKIDKKEPKSLTEIMAALVELHPTIHQLNLYFYRCYREFNIIDIKFIIKNIAFDPLSKSIETDEPHLHCKIEIPPYFHFIQKEKFDINWKWHPWEYKWNMFLLKFKMRFLKKLMPHKSKISFRNNLTIRL